MSMDYLILSGVSWNKQSDSSFYRCKCIFNTNLKCTNAHSPNIMRQQFVEVKLSEHKIVCIYLKINSNKIQQIKFKKIANENFRLFSLHKEIFRSTCVFLQTYINYFSIYYTREESDRAKGFISTLYKNMQIEFIVISIPYMNL